MNRLEPVLDLELLRTLTVIVDSGGFTEAAKRLHRTQSAISMQVKRLEDSLGVRLLHRNRSRIVLTSEGETLLDYGRRMLSLNDEIRQSLSAPAVEGTVRLGIPDDYAFYLPNILARFAELYPAVTLDVRCELSVDLVQELREGNIDLAVVTRQPKSPGGHVLRSEQLIWAAAQQTGAEHRSVLPLALFPEGYCVFRELTLEALRSAGCPWRIAYTSRSLEGLLSAVSAGLAVTVITRSMLREGLREIEPEGPAGLPPLPQVEIALHRSPGRPSESTQKLTELISDSLSIIST
ncbi:MAG: LysR substrate-binding domain-containing protein [Desulfovermiculus sp.]